MSTAVQDFYKVMYNKADLIRYSHPSNQLINPDTDEVTRKPDRKKTSLVPDLQYSDELLAEIDKVSAKDHKRIKPEFIGKKPVTAEELVAAEVALLENVGMRPPTANTKAKLYTGFSKIGEGRHAYLDARKRVPLEQRYPVPPTNTADIGWCVQQHQKKQPGPHASIHGRNCIVSDTFYRSNGVLPAVES